MPNLNSRGCRPPAKPRDPRFVSIPEVETLLQAVTQLNDFNESPANDEQSDSKIKIRLITSLMQNK